MKIIIIGGHLSPALAVIENLPKEAEALYIGRKYALEGDKAESLEYQTIRSKNIKFAEIKTGRLQRKFTKFTITSLFKLPFGFFQAFSILKSFSPDVVLGFGSYVSMPILLAAYFLRIPIVIHEQTFGAGLANKFASFFATKICISWEKSRKFFPASKTILTGLPVQTVKLQASTFKLPNTFPLIYITGGSQGSHFINTMVEGCLEDLLQKFNIFHQTGDAKEYKDFDRLNSLKKGLSKEFQERYVIKKFIDPSEVSSIFKNASLIVGRSGMGTVSELILYKKIALLIPLPIAAKNEQMENALFLKEKGTVEIVEQKDLDPKIFLQKILEMVNNLDDYKNNTTNLKDLLISDAASKIIEVIKDVKKKR